MSLKTSLGKRPTCPRPLSLSLINPEVDEKKEGKTESKGGREGGKMKRRKTEDER